MLKFRIVILNYNGLTLIPKCLPSILEAVNKYPFGTITILDNQSPEGDYEVLKKEYGEILTVESAPKNKVLCSYNDYLKKIDEPIAILLNNDIRVDADFIAPLIKKFEQDPETFLVAPRVMSFDGAQIEAARTKLSYRWGILGCDGRYPGFEKEAMTPSETVSSGFGAFSRTKFLELDGYDEIYMPGIIEDLDLCYRAQKKGYHLYYEPSSVVYHMGQASFKKAFGQEQISRLAHRNTFLFMWKNLTGFGFWASHLLFIPPRLIHAFIFGRKTFYQGFFDALKSRRVFTK